MGADLLIEGYDDRIDFLYWIIYALCGVITVVVPTLFWLVINCLKDKTTQISYQNSQMSEMNEERIIQDQQNREVIQSLKRVMVDLVDESKKFEKVLKQVRKAGL